MKLQSITAHEIFYNVKASTLFELYTQAAKHEQVTGSPALITDKLGEPFNLYNGFCFGENIEIKKDKLIVQAWRTEDWPEGLDDSILIIRLIEVGNNTHLYLTHTDLPEEMAESLHKGWEEFYWRKWRTYLNHE